MSRSLRPGWYIVLYHDVSWEEGPFLRHIGGSCPPDMFRHHILSCREIGELVSVRTGLERLRSGEIDKPLFSFWFDDGLRSVRKYAAPILKSFGATAATSVCSRFMARTEMFWRFKLSYLHSVDAGRHLRSRLRPLGLSAKDLTRNFTIRNFDTQIVSIIDQLYNDCTNEAVRQDAFRLFDTPSGIAELLAEGWEIANHSAAHYPIGQSHTRDITWNQFDEAEKVIEDLTGRPTDFWVLPFGPEIDDEIAASIRQSRQGRLAVLVQDRVNQFSPAQEPRVLYRIQPSTTDRQGLLRAVHAASNT